MLDARYSGQKAAGYAVVKNLLPSPQVPLAVNVYLSLALLI